MASYAQQRGETVQEWRGKISWEKRWRNLLQGKTASGLEIDRISTHAFVKATPVTTTHPAAQSAVSTPHLRITIAGVRGSALQASIDWPMQHLHSSSQWLREVLA